MQRLIDAAHGCSASLMQHTDAHSDASPNWAYRFPLKRNSESAPSCHTCTDESLEYRMNGRCYPTGGRQSGATPSKTASTAAAAVATPSTAAASAAAAAALLFVFCICF